jgi:hypothetical protein
VLYPDAPTPTKPLPSAAQLENLTAARTVQVVWNGHALEGDGAVSDFLAKLPASKHEPSSLDCQPIADLETVPGQDPKDPMILVSVSGTVQFGSIESTPPPQARPFCQSFVRILGQTSGAPREQYRQRSSPDLSCVTQVLGKDSQRGQYFIVTDTYRFM